MKGYLPPQHEESQRNGILLLKLQRVQRENDALQATIDGLTQFICAVAHNSPDGMLSVDAPSMHGNYNAQWNTYPDKSILVKVDKL